MKYSSGLLFYLEPYMKLSSIINEIKEIATKEITDNDLANAGIMVKSAQNSAGRSRISFDFDDGYNNDYRVTCMEKIFRTKSEAMYTAWDISFSIGSQFHLTNLYLQNTVYTKVLMGLKYFIEQMKPNIMSFSTSDQKTHKTYQRFIRYVSDRYYTIYKREEYQDSNDIEGTYVLINKEFLESVNIKPEDRIWIKELISNSGKYMADVADAVSRSKNKERDTRRMAKSPYMSVRSEIKRYSLQFIIHLFLAESTYPSHYVMGRIISISSINTQESYKPFFDVYTDVTNDPIRMIQLNLPDLKEYKTAVEQEYKRMGTAEFDGTAMSDFITYEDYHKIFLKTLRDGIEELLKTNISTTDETWRDRLRNSEFAIAAGVK